MLEDYTFGLDRTIVFNGIGLFRRPLKELFIDGPCTYYFSLTTLLGLLPALTHLQIKLTYLCSIMPFEDDQSINEEIRSDNDDNSSNDEMYNLVFLSLFSETYINTGIKQIVKRCPRLKYLLASNTVIKEQDELPPVDLATILELCPSIRYVHWGEYTVTKKIEKEWLTLSRRKREYTDNENTSDYEKGAANHLRRVEFCSHIEEGHISALGVCLQQPSLLERLRLFGCNMVNLYRLWNSFIHLNGNLSLQFPELKSLELIRFGVPHQTENNMFFENFFSHFQHIERLKMELNVVHVDNVEQERSSIYKMVEAIVHQLHQIQCLHIELSDRIKLDTKMVLDDKLFTPLCDGIQKLEILHLHNVPISNDVLLHLADHPKLHTLSLSGYGLHNQLSKDPWISYARKCKEQEQSNNGRIRSILLGQCGYGVTDEVLEEFAGIKSLETLRIVRSSSITDAGVNKFESIKNSSSKKHKKIELYDCTDVSLDNPNAVFVHPPF